MYMNIYSVKYVPHTCMHKYITLNFTGMFLLMRNIPYYMMNAIYHICTYKIFYLKAGFGDQTAGNGQAEDWSRSIQTCRERENGGSNPSNKWRKGSGRAWTSSPKVGQGYANYYVAGTFSE